MSVYVLLKDSSNLSSSMAGRSEGGRVAPERPRAGRWVEGVRHAARPTLGHPPDISRSTRVAGEEPAGKSLYDGKAANSLS